MVNETSKQQALNRIRQNIARIGYHLYVVSGGAIPRFAYTIGLTESMGFELILAGAFIYLKDDIVQILNQLMERLKTERSTGVFELAEQGSFTLVEVDGGWAKELMLGAFDYYPKRDILAFQIVPDKAHRTIDVPDLSLPWDASSEPIWRWLYESWTYPVPAEATATTNLAALRGLRITEVMRWEENEWEMFSGDGSASTKEEIRVVPLGTFIAVDESILPVLTLPVGEGLWRNPQLGSDWHPWRISG